MLRIRNDELYVKCLLYCLLCTAFSSVCKESPLIYQTVGYIDHHSRLKDLSDHTVPAHHARLRLQGSVRRRRVDIIRKVKEVVNTNLFTGYRPANLCRQALVDCSLISMRRPNHHG